MKTIARHDLPPRGRIVVFNGPSSAGKSSLAKELQSLLPEAYLHVQLDAFRAMEPADYFRPGQPALSALRVAALCRALNATALEYARHGQHVLLDHVLPPEGWQYLTEDFAAFPVLLVGLRCEWEELDARERHRGDRPRGLAASQAEIHSGRRYDFEIDTTRREVAECARETALWLKGSPAPHAFMEIVREHTAV